MRHHVPIRSFKHTYKAVIGTAAVLIVLGIAGCGGSGGGGSAIHNKLASLVERTTDRDSSYSGCVADELIKRGYDTDAEIAPLETIAVLASQTRDASQVPIPVLDALNACDTTG